MSFVFVILTGLLFGAAAMRTSRVVSLHLLAIWVYFSALPALTTLIVVSDTGLREAMVDYAHLPILYLVGVLLASAVMRDGTTSARLLNRLAQLRHDRTGHMALQYMFAAVFTVDFLLRLFYNILGSGTASDQVVLELPYQVTTILFISSELLFGLFCYACLTVRLSKLAKILVAAFIAYMLISEGRRSFLLSVIALVVLGAGDFRFRLNARVIGLLGVASLLFLALSPIFLQFRMNLQTIQLTYGVSSINAFPEAVRTTMATIGQGTTGILQDTSANVAERGNAGVFFFRVAKSIPNYQDGAMIATSIQWLIPSVFIQKPQALTETLIQYAAGLPLIDDANSIPTIFLADFGPLGVAIAGFITAMLLYGVARVLARPGRLGLLGVYLLGVLLARSFRIEGEFSEFLAFFRNLVLILLLDIGWRFVVRNRPSTDEVPAQRRLAPVAS